MEIKHRFVLPSAPESVGGLRAQLEALGIDVPDSGVVVISEDDPGFDDAAALLRSVEALEDVDTTFSPTELRDADVLLLNTPGWLHGYPEPSDDLSYLHLTYDLSDYCEDCGVGAVQHAPFRIKSAPKWGRRSIFALNWILDEYFVPTRLWHDVFRPAGVDARPVLLQRSGEVADNVVQLVLPKRVHMDLKDSRLRELVILRCRRCRREKTEGFFYVGFPPRPSHPVEDPMFKSFEYNGSGACAGNAVYISAALYAKIASIRGITFRPVLPASSRS